MKSPQFIDGDTLHPTPHTPHPTPFLKNPCELANEERETEAEHLRLLVRGDVKWIFP